MGQHIAPVIVVLDEIPLGEADAITDGLSSDADVRNGEVTGLAEVSFDAVLSKDGFIESCRAECVGPVSLKSALHGVAGSGELWNGVRSAVVQKVRKKLP